MNFSTKPQNDHIYSNFLSQRAVKARIITNCTWKGNFLPYIMIWKQGCSFFTLPFCLWNIIQKRLIGLNLFLKNENSSFFVNLNLIVWTTINDPQQFINKLQQCMSNLREPQQLHTNECAMEAFERVKSTHVWTSIYDRGGMS